MAGCNGSKVCTVGEVEFKVVADSVFRVPAPGGETPVELALKITNRRKTPVRFKKMDTLFVTLTGPDGRKLLMDGGRDGTVPGETISPLVAPGQSLLIDRTGRLLWAKDATLRLIGGDGFGGIWHIDGLKRGKYQLQIEYENVQVSGSSGGTVWTGKAVTPPKEVELK